jgi:GcrA cell cycle regulator
MRADLGIVPWTHEEKAFVRQLVGEKLSARVIAERLTASGRSVTRNAVIGIVGRMGLRLAGKAEAAKPPRPKLPRPKPPRRKPVPAAAKPVAASPVDDALKPAGQDFANVTFAGLLSHHCKWPVGDPGAPGFGFCGGARMFGTPYCAGQNRRAWDRSSQQGKGVRA